MIFFIHCKLFLKISIEIMIAKINKETAFDRFKTSTSCVFVDEIK